MVGIMAVEVVGFEMVQGAVKMVLKELNLEKGNGKMEKDVEVVEQSIIYSLPSEGDELIYQIKSLKGFCG